MSHIFKIAHLTSAHKDNDVRIFHKQCISLAENGHQVSLVVPNTRNRQENGVQIVSFNYKSSSRFTRMWHLVNGVYKKALELNADMYHIHDPELLRIALKLKRKGKKVIYDAHEDLPRQVMSKHYIPLFLRKIVSFLVEHYENYIAGKLDGVITATPYIEKRFLMINQNTIAVNNFPILHELILEEKYPHKSENIICYVGGMTKIRGAVEMIKAIESLNIKLLIAGSFLEPYLKDELMKLNGWNKIEELGFVNRNAVREVYSKSKLGLVVLHPTTNYLDSLPVKMFEYMASGLPVVASNFPLWKEIIEKNNCGICVDPLNVKQISNAIQYILDNPEHAKVMGENGKKAVLEKYNWDIEKQKLFSFYNTIILKS